MYNVASTNIIYHYFPKFRRQVFARIAERVTDAQFIYGRNSRFGVSSLADENHHLRKNWFVGNFIFQSFGLSTLRLIIRNHNVILGDLKFINSWLYAILGRLAGRKVLFWTHGVLQREGGMKWAIRKIYYNLADGLLLYSSHEAELMRELGYDKPIHVVGNANYDAIELKSVLPPMQGDGANAVCYIGRISPEKGLADFASLAERNPDRRIVLVGPITAECEPYKGRYENLVFKPQRYDYDSLISAVAGCDKLVMFSPAGLSLFTAIVLGLRPLIQIYAVQKPEYHLLRQYGLITEFGDLEELESILKNPARNDSEFAAAREIFLKENSAEMVTLRIANALGMSDAESEGADA